MKSAKFLQKFYTGEKNIYTIFTHFAHFFANIFANIFVKIFAQIFTQFLHKIYTIFTHYHSLHAVQRGKFFLTQFLHILQKNLQNFLHIFLHNFYTPFCTNFAPFLQLHILQIFLHLRPREESVSSIKENRPLSTLALS